MVNIKLVTMNLKDYFNHHDTETRKEVLRAVKIKFRVDYQLADEIYIEWRKEYMKSRGIR